MVVVVVSSTGSGVRAALPHVIPCHVLSISSSLFSCHATWCHVSYVMLRRAELCSHVVHRLNLFDRGGALSKPGGGGCAHSVHLD